MEEEQKPQAQVYLLKTHAGQWSFEVRQDEEILGGGAGYADQFEALEGAQDAFPHLLLQAVIQGPEEAAPSFTRGEWYEINDSLNRYIEHMLEAGQTDVERSYRSLQTAWSAQKKVLIVLGLDTPWPAWVQERDIKLAAAIKSAQGAAPK